MPDRDVAPVPQSWQRIDAWLTAHAPAALESLHPPASDIEIEEAEAAMGLTFPADLRASLRCHGGAEAGSPVLPAGWLIDTGQIVEEWRERIDNWDDAWDLDDASLFIHPQWIPWASFEGDPMVIDMRPGPQQGRLGAAFLDGGTDFSHWICSPSLAAYLHTVAETLLGGGVVDGRRPVLTTDHSLRWEHRPNARDGSGER